MVKCKQEKILNMLNIYLNKVIWLALAACAIGENYVSTSKSV